MSYDGGLKALRAKMLSQSTGRDVAEERGVESFIPARGGEQPQQEDTQDMISRGATWLADIRKASAEFKAANATGNEHNRVASAGAKTGLASAVDNFARGLSSEVEGKEEEKKPEEGFVPRRPTSSGGPKGDRELDIGIPVPVDAKMGGVLDAIAAVESKGSGDYEAVGPVVQKGMYKGQRAYGRYQVMEGNIPSWSKAALGKTISLEEFKASPKAQDAIAAHQLQKSKDKFGTWEDAASVWFSGRPFSNKNNANDGYTSVPEYISKFRKNYVG